MVDWNELKRLAERENQLFEDVTPEAGEEWPDAHDELAAALVGGCFTKTILALIAENESFRACLEGASYGSIDRMARQGPDMSRRVGEAAKQLTLQMIAERDQLRAELERARAEGELLRKHLTECADSLESEILDRFGSSKDHPAMRRKFELEMRDVIEARAAMGKGGRADG